MHIKPTIRVRYSCPKCGLKAVELEVPAREEEDVVEWMRDTTMRTWIDHGRRSPRCGADELRDLMIPIQGADRLGGAPRH